MKNIWIQLENYSEVLLSIIIVLNLIFSLFFEQGRDILVPFAIIAIISCVSKWYKAQKTRRQRINFILIISVMILFVILRRFI